MERRQFIGFFISLAIFAVVLWLLPAEVAWQAKGSIAVMVAGLYLWAFEPIPIGFASMLLLILLMLVGAISPKEAFQGFGSPAIFLVMAGMMIAKGVNQTTLGTRLSYWILSKTGGTVKGTLAGLFSIMTIQAFFIPATAVRTTLVLPMALNVVEWLKAGPESKTRKLILMGVAIGGNISGTAVMTAAIGNIITVELIRLYLHVEISYLQWMLYTLPLWLLLIPAMWWLLLRIYPPEQNEFPQLKTEMKQRLQQMGAMNAADKRTIGILVITVALWMTEPLHGLNPVIPALVGVALMALPLTGIAPWQKLVEINVDTILVLGATLSLGQALNQTGAVDYLGSILSQDWIVSLLSDPIGSVIFIVLATQLYHLGLSNVSTAVVTLIPLLIHLSGVAGVDPVWISFLAGLTCLHGYLLVVETMPNLLVYSTGMVTQRDFLYSGWWATFVTSGLTIFIALTWWKWLGPIH